MTGAIQFRRCTAACAVLLAGLLGSGFAVYDVANHTAALQQYQVLWAMWRNQVGTMSPNLTRLLRVNEQQERRLADLLQRLGVPPGAPGRVLPGSGPLSFTWGELRELEGSGDAWERLFEPRGAMSVYAGLGRADWLSWVQGSWRTWSAATRADLMGEAAARAELGAAERAIAERVAAMGQAELRARRSEVAAELSRLAADRWLDGGEDRRERLRALAAVAARQRQEANRADTLTEAFVAANEASAQQGVIAVEAARQASEAAEAHALASRAMLEAAEAERRRARREGAVRWAGADVP